MKWNPLKWPISCLTGVIATIIALIFFPISISLFSGKNYIGEDYNLIKHYMSDLGNYNFNPKGAIFFNLCIILIGILALPFFYGISHFKGQIKRQNLIKPFQILGVCTSFSFIMVGIFSENAPHNLHFIWSIFSWGFVLIDLIAASIGLKDATGFLPILGYYGYIIAAINAILLVTWSPFIEWLTFLSTLLFVELVLYSGFKIEFSA